MTEHRWFIPDLDDPAEITDDERAFAAALSEATADLVCSDVSDTLIPAAYGDCDNPLVAGLCVVDSFEGRLKEIINIGVHFHGDRVSGGELHNQLYYICGQPPGMALDVTGSLDVLVERTADWFSSVLRRPIGLYVWLNDGYAYAARFAFADSSETLSQAYVKQLAPEGQYEQVVAAGHVHGKGWLQTAGLPTPDLYLHIRGDMQRAQIPSGVGRTQERGPLPTFWYR